jgi:hypothetical protein
VESPVEKLAQDARAAAAEAMTDRTAGCDACAALRRELGDQTALCDAHFAALVGVRTGDGPGE